MSLNEIVGLKQFNALRLSQEAESVLIYGELQNTDTTCPACGKDALKPHQYYQRRVRHLPVLEKPTYLVFERKDWICECGKVFLERLPFQDIRSLYTHDYETRIYERCRYSPIETIAREEGLDWNTVARIFKKRSLAQRKSTRNRRGGEFNHLTSGRNSLEEGAFPV